MSETIDLSAFPDEVTDYAFDQLQDRIGKVIDEGEAIRAVRECVQCEYESQTVDVGTTVVNCALRDAMREKLNDMRREVANGQRDDYTVEEIDNLRCMEVGN